MVQIVLPIAALLVSQIMLWLGSGLLSTVIALRMDASGFTSTSAGLVMSGFYFGIVIAALRAGQVIRAVGHIRAFAAMASVLSAATLLHGFSDDAVLWWCLRFIEGMCIAGLAVVSESWLNERSSNADRGTILSIYTLTTGVSTGAGQFLLNLSPVTGFTLLVVSSILLSLCLVPVTMTRGPAPALGEVSRLNLRALWRISPLGVTGCFSSGVVIGGFNSLGPIYGQTSGMTVEEVAIFMGVAITGGMILQFPIGRLSDYLPRRWVMFGATVGLTASAAVIALLTPTGEAGSLLGLVVIIVFGACIYILYPLALAQTNDHLQPADFLAASGSLVLIYGIGAVLGPILASQVMERTGPVGLFAFLVVTGIVLALFSLYRMMFGPTQEVEEQTPYQMVPRTSAMAYELDPRMEDDQLSFDFMDGDVADESVVEEEAAHERVQ